ncbi:hypothetical protein PCL_03464 [Purpureocillium lilacinum]|uniref:Uncharacterized protein n=1 Tax=Purpureocillium lilacinum TaxID=33203 RepID=A0A2U3EP62_PURLI|nr:hypothetical protein PCL_03464 [Purpureocillium lilacinum]
MHEQEISTSTSFCVSIRNTADRQLQKVDARMQGSCDFDNGRDAEPQPRARELAPSFVCSYMAAATAPDQDQPSASPVTTLAAPGPKFTIHWRLSRSIQSSDLRSQPQSDCQHGWSDLSAAASSPVKSDSFTVSSGAAPGRARAFSPVSQPAGQRNYVNAVSHSAQATNTGERRADLSPIAARPLQPTSLENEQQRNLVPQPRRGGTPGSNTPRNMPVQPSWATPPLRSVCLASFHGRVSIPGLE